MAVIAALGDSITNGYWDEENTGWFTRMAEKLTRARPNYYGFNNMSMGGDRVCDIFHRFASETLTREYDFLLVALGINDTRRAPEVTSPMDLSESARLEYWERFLGLAKKIVPKIVIFDLLPVIEERCPEAGWNNVPSYNFNRDIEDYNEFLCALSARMNVAFFSRYPDWKGRDLRELYVDWVHPNARGHELIAQQACDYLSENVLK